MLFANVSCFAVACGLELVLSSMNIDEQPREIQEKWLHQRGWRSRGPSFWVHPDTGVPYGFNYALKLAQQDARLPADMELNVETPRRPDVIVTAFGTTIY